MTEFSAASSTGSKEGLTVHLERWRLSGAESFGPVYELAERELRAIARQRLAGNWMGGQALTPPELLNELVIRLLEKQPEFTSGKHFLATASLMMRSILIDSARAMCTESRGGGVAAVTYTESASAQDSLTLDLLALDEALRQLEQSSPRAAQAVHLTYFAGMSNTEVSEVLDVSLATVERELKFGRAWVRRALQGQKI